MHIRIPPTAAAVSQSSLLALMALLLLPMCGADGSGMEPPVLQHLFVPGTLGFTSFRGTVLVSTPTHVVAFSTGRCSGTPACRGDISSRSIVVRTSTEGGSPGSWSPATIIANVSSQTLRAMDGLYTGTGTYDPYTKEVQLYWGECLEKCHPHAGGQVVMAAPTFMLTVSKFPFRAWKHINQTALLVDKLHPPDPERLLSEHNFRGVVVLPKPLPTAVDSLLPYNWFDNAVVHLPNLTTVLAGSFRNFSAPAGPECAEAVCNRPVPGCWASDDHGRTMARGNMLQPPPAPPSEYIRLDEPQLGRLSNGTLLLVGHGDAISPGRNTLAMASSTDNGLTFDNLHKIPHLVQPGCGLGMLITTDDTIYLSFDNNGTLASAAPNAHDNSRNNLTVSHSVSMLVSPQTQVQTPAHHLQSTSLIDAHSVTSADGLRVYLEQPLCRQAVHRVVDAGGCGGGRWREEAGCDVGRRA
eukprot:SAG11_NODE_1645_length_4524_cov_7.819435_3_plen_468_part_00